MRLFRAAALALLASACASAPPPVAPGPTYEEKIAFIVRLEDQRMLAEPAPVVPAAATAATTRTAAAAPAAPPPLTLARLLGDAEPRVRRRAALGLGRIGLEEGIDLLLPRLADPEPEVRQMTAFALGLIGDARASAALLQALEDPAPMVQGSAAEALGAIGDKAAAPAIATMASTILASGALAGTLAEQEAVRRDTPAAAFRLAVFALARLDASDALATAVLDEAGQPRVRWWPVAYALQRVEDRRAVPALLGLASDPDPYTRAFAIRGLGALEESSAAPVLLPQIESRDRAVAIEAIRALGRIGDPAATEPLLTLVRAPGTSPHQRLEAVAALGVLGGEGVYDTLLDLLGDRNPAIRAAALVALGKLGADGFVTVLSGLDPDRHWNVRAVLAGVLGTLPPEAALPRLRTMLEDEDQRVIPQVLASLTALRAPEAVEVLTTRLDSDDPVVRAAAARGLGRLKPAGARAALEAAYRRGVRDQSYVARAAALEALAAYGADAQALLVEALGDPDWAVRVRAAELLEPLEGPPDVAARIRPAPTAFTPDVYAAPRVANPPVSPQAYIETERGIVQIELAVIDAPLTVENFVRLARQRFFDGLPVHRVVPGFVVQGGDPRGDGEGGAGYTIRDELNQLPYVRGTVGMALDWRDTGGSQFFITQSPQPHLDGRYTVFGRVVSGMEIVDEMQQWDVIRRVYVWDGESLE
jgi:HEAT repeat protein/cyclophilin family peptidyl-prolyl cis-trans isomerase